MQYKNIWSIVKSKNLWIGIAIVAILVLNWWPVESDKDEKVEKGVLIRRDKDPVVQKQKVGSIAWEMEPIYIPEKMQIYKVMDMELETTIKKWESYFGLTKKTETEKIISYSNEQDEAYGDIILAEKEFDYGIDLLGKELTYRGNLNRDDYELRLFDVMTKLSNYPNEFEVYITDFEYEKIEGPRFVSSNSTEADVVSVEAGIKIDGYPTRTELGWPIQAMFDRRGKIVKLKIVNPVLKLEKWQEEKTISLEEVKNFPAEYFDILEVESSAYYDQHWGEEAVKNSNITKIEVGYVIRNGLAEPYLIAEGNSMMEMGPIKIVLGTSLVAK